MKTGLADLLKQRSEADAVYRLTCEISNLHAVQGRNEGHTKLRAQTMAEIADTKHVEGTPADGMALPIDRRRTRRTEKEKEIQTYFFERNGKPDTILLEVGGPFGLFGKALRDAACAKGKGRYLDYMQSLALIRFAVAGSTERPVGAKTRTTIESRGVLLGQMERYVEVKAQTTIDSLDGTDRSSPLPRMEPRNSRGKAAVMVPVFHERLSHPITVTVDMLVSSECPRSEEEVAGLLHGMQSVPFGPAKRGRMRIQKVERMKLAE